MQKYSNYITSLAMALQVMFLTASVVRFHQRFVLAIGLPNSVALAEHYMGSELVYISIDARQNIYISFSSKRDMQAVAKRHITYYDNSTIKINSHDELLSILRELRERCLGTQIVIAGNETLPNQIIMELFTTLGDANYYKYHLLTIW